MKLNEEQRTGSWIVEIEEYWESWRVTGRDDKDTLYTYMKISKRKRNLK